MVEIEFSRVRSHVIVIQARKMCWGRGKKVEQRGWKVSGRSRGMRSEIDGLLKRELMGLRRESIRMGDGFQWALLVQYELVGQEMTATVKS